MAPSSRLLAVALLSLIGSLAAARQDEHPFIMPGTAAKTVPAPTPWLTGEQLLRRLERAEHSAVMEYIKGVFDATESGLWCYTDRRHIRTPKLSPEAMRAQILAALRRLPTKRLQERAAVLIAETWQERWPCPPDGCCPGRGY